MENIISVLVTTYNQEKTIARTLDAILAQQCRWPVEIVLAEDGSTDLTPDICRQYAQRYPKRIRLLANEKNKGLNDNYFDALLQCSGKYIADCAGDDFWVDCHKLEKELNILESHPEVTLVHTDWLYYDETTQKTMAPPPTRFAAPFTPGRELIEAMITQTERPVVHLCTALFRAETIFDAYHEDTFMFRNKEFGCEDLQMTTALAYAGVVAFLPEVTLHYSVGHSSVSSQPDHRRQFLFVRRVTDLSFYMMRKYHVTADATTNYFHKRLFALTMHAFRANDAILMAEVNECEKRWGVKKDLKTRLLGALLRSHALWQLLLYLRKKVRQPFANSFR